MPILSFASMFSLAALLVFVVVRAHGRGKRPKDRGTSSPRCGRCRYVVRGLPGRTCPECGGDLDEVGIVHDDRRGQIPNWLAVWILVGIFVAWPAAGIIPRYVPSILSIPWRKAWDLTLVGPSTGAYRSVRIVAEDKARRKQDLDLATATRTLSLIHLDGREDRLTIPSSDMPVSGASIEEWLREGGIRPGPDRRLLRDEAATIAAATRSMDAIEVHGRMRATWKSHKTWRPISSSAREALVPFDRIGGGSGGAGRVAGVSAFRPFVVTGIAGAWLLGLYALWLRASRRGS